MAVYDTILARTNLELVVCEKELRHDFCNFAVGENRKMNTKLLTYFPYNIQS